MQPITKSRCAYRTNPLVSPVEVSAFILAPEIVCDGVWRGDGAFEAPGVYTPPWKPIPRPQRVMSYVSLHLVQNLGPVTHVPKEVSPKIVESWKEGGSSARLRRIGLGNIFKRNRQWRHTGS